MDHGGRRERIVIPSILRRKARVRGRGYVGILKRAPILGEARWHRGNEKILISRP